MLRKIYAVLLVLLICLVSYDAYAKVRNYLLIVERQREASNKFVRDRVVKLIGDDGGYCSGFLVKSKKGRMFIITARHCQGHLFNERMTAVSSDGTNFIVTVVEVSTSSDVMLMSGFGKKHLKLARTNRQFERVHTVAFHNTRGPYREEGDCICFTDPLPVYAPLAMPCNEDKTPTLGGVLVTNMKAIPGASGGPILNYKNEVVGMVSYIEFETGYTFSPTLLDINGLLKDK